MDEVEVVVAHSERATLRVGDCEVDVLRSRMRAAAARARLPVRRRRSA